MRVPPFTMERWQSTYEHRVDFNLSESGVHPFTLAELLDLIDLDPADVLLGYGQSDGSDGLKARIAALYDGAKPINVVATTGGAEANYVVVWSLVSPGDRVVVIEPTYGQTPGLARALGAEVVSVPLVESLCWQPAPGSVAEAVTAETRLVIVTNPPRASSERTSASWRPGLSPRRTACPAFVWGGSWRPPIGTSSCGRTRTTRPSRHRRCRTSPPSGSSRPRSARGSSTAPAGSSGRTCPRSRPGSISAATCSATARPMPVRSVTYGTRWM